MLDMPHPNESNNLLNLAFLCAVSVLIFKMGKFLMFRFAIKDLTF